MRLLEALQVLDEQPKIANPKSRIDRAASRSSSLGFLVPLSKH
jgi:hypothetical protein